MNVGEAVLTRRAVRAYTSEPVAEAALERLIDAAIQAPSAMNAQPWSFCVIRDRALLDRISRESKARLLAEPPPGLDATRIRSLIGAEGFDILYHAPALVLISTADDSRWGIMACSLAAANLMLTARAMGLGSCWIGLAEPWLSSPEGRAALGLPDDVRPVAPIIIGHPSDPDLPAVPRQPPEIDWLD